MIILSMLQAYIVDELILNGRSLKTPQSQL